MNENQSESSSTNTILIVLVLVAIVGFGVWFFTQRTAAPAPKEGFDVNVTLPTPDNGQQGQNNGAPANTTPATPQ